MLCMGGGFSKVDELEVLGGVIFFNHGNFDVGEEGFYKSARKYPHGNYPTVEDYNDAFSSLRIAPGCKVIMYKDENYGGMSVTKPDNNVIVSETKIPNLRELSMGDAISSFKVECDAKEYCRLKPSLESPDCRPECPSGTLCNVKIAEYCSKNLGLPKCKEFCMDPMNKCNDEDVENYCKRSKEEAGKIPDECQCILQPPSNELERRIDAGNGGVYDGKIQKKRGNYACWSKKCKNGTVPQLGQLHLSQWWNEKYACTPITICDIDLGDTKLSMYDDSVLVVKNNCGSGVSGESLLKEESTQIETNTENEIDSKTKLLIIAALFLCLLLYVVTSKRHKKLKKKLEMSGIYV